MNERNNNHLTSVSYEQLLLKERFTKNLKKNELCNKIRYNYVKPYTN